MMFEKFFQIMMKEMWIYIGKIIIDI